MLFVVLLLSACEQRTTVELAEGPPVVFVVAGSGLLSQLTVYGPAQDGVAYPEDSKDAIWEIVPMEGDGEHVSNLHSIRYGVVPDGYEQTVPRNGAPIPLLEYKRYFYRLVTMNAPHASGYFEIRNGSPIEVKEPCFELRDGKWFQVKCP